VVRRTDAVAALLDGHVAAAAAVAATATTAGDDLLR